MVGDYDALGWVKFPVDPELVDWLRFAGPAAIDAMKTDAPPPLGFDCEGTWFVGVDALPNDAVGAVAGSGSLGGVAVRYLQDKFGTPLPNLHRGQVSSVFPGYPKPRVNEGEAAFNYRLTRDAAHVDGLLPVGPERARMIQEPHAFILGLPVTDCNANTSPLVVWEGSHVIMRHAFEAALSLHPAHQWGKIDVTAAYQSARREVFRTCRRVKVVAKPGEAYILHRHCLHGVSAWEEGAEAPAEGRIIIYFRPEYPGGVQEWLTQP